MDRPGREESAFLLVVIQRGLPSSRFNIGPFEQGDEKLITSQKLISPVVDVGLQYCPWCGRDLERWYEKHVDELHRPHLRISSS